MLTQGCNTYGGSGSRAPAYNRSLYFLLWLSELGYNRGPSSTGLVDMAMLARRVM